jgi:hypothetical protein
MEEDEWGTREYLRTLIGKMYAYKSYQDIADEVVDSATRNGKKAADYAPNDPFCVQVEKAAIRFKKDKVKELNAPDKWGNGAQRGQQIWYVGTQMAPGGYWRRGYIHYFNRR